MSCCMKRSRTLEMVSNLQGKFFALKVRRDGPQPSILQEPIYVSGPLNSELLLAPSLSASRQFTGNESEKRTELRQTTEASTVKDPFHELRLLSQRSMSGQLECHGR